MSNYAESKKVLDKIRNEYGCSGDIIFRTAIQYVMEYGQNTFVKTYWVNERLSEVDEKHDDAEKENKTLWISRDFEKAIIQCAADLATVNSYDLLIYVQREVWLGGDGMDYQRAIQLLKKCMNWIEDDRCGYAETLDTFEHIGFRDDEIESFGYAYLFDCVDKYDIEDGE